MTQEIEGAGAYLVSAPPIRAGQLSGRDVLEQAPRQHGHQGQGVEQAGIGALKIDDHTIRTHNPHIGNSGQSRLENRARTRVANQIQGELNISRGEGLAIVPLNPIANHKDLLFTVIANRPALGHLPLQPLDVRIVVEHQGHKVLLRPSETSGCGQWDVDPGAPPGPTSKPPVRAPWARPVPSPSARTVAIMDLIQLFI